MRNNSFDINNSLQSIIQHKITIFYTHLNTASFSFKYQSNKTNTVAISKNCLYKLRGGVIVREIIRVGSVAGISSF
jgi:hypothetical protein